MTYVISDTHFNDDRTFPFDKEVIKDKNMSKKELDELQVQNWNSTVRPDDIIYHLGDFGKFSNAKALKDFVAKLTGHKILMLGNHDIELALDLRGITGYGGENKAEHYRAQQEIIQFWFDAGFSMVYAQPTFINKFMSISHEPPQFVHVPFLRLFGHVHTSMLYRTITPASTCVCACRWGFTPVSLQRIKELTTACRNIIMESNATGSMDYFPEDAIELV